MIGILISITIPALRGARERAGETTSVSRAGQCAGIITGWALEHGDRYPAARPGVPYPGPPMTSLSGNDELFRFATKHLWAAIIFRAEGLREPWPALMSPGVGDDDSEARFGGALPSYFFSQSFVADPRLWTPSPSSAVPNASSPLLRDIKIGEVAHPSQKAMIHDWDLAYLARRPRASINGLRDVPTPIAFADGHAAAHNPTNATPPFPNPFNIEWSDVAIHNTPNGVHGVDFR